MATHWTLGCDAVDPQRQAAFWALALGYVPEPGYEGPDSASIVDPVGRLPLDTSPWSSSCCGGEVAALRRSGAYSERARSPCCETFSNTAT